MTGTARCSGWRSRAPYSQGVADIEPGVTLVLYTDGLVERRGEVIDDGLGRLADAVGRHAAQRRRPALLPAAARRAHRHRAGPPTTSPSSPPG